MAERDRELCLKRSSLLTRRTFGEIRRHRHAMADHRPALPGLVDHLNLMLALSGSESPLFPRRRVVVLIATIRALFYFQRAVIDKPGRFIEQTQGAVVV